MVSDGSAHLGCGVARGARRRSKMIHPSALCVHGGRKLEGRVAVAGFKHSLVTAVAGASIADAPLVIRNCPTIVEVDVLACLLTSLGATATRTSTTLTIDASTITRRDLDPALAGAIHGSVYLAPALLSRFGEATLLVEGGCQIGDGSAGRRPHEQYVSVLERFGGRLAAVDASGLRISASRLRGCDIDLLDYTADPSQRTGPLYSGACKMAILAAAIAEGTSVLSNLYPKPDVGDLVTVIAALGADVEHDGELLIIRGKGAGTLDQAAKHDLIPDLIEIVTWITAGALVGSRLLITAPQLARAHAAMGPELRVLGEMGIVTELRGDELRVAPAERIRSVNLVVTSPGIYSDSHPFFSLLATHAVGTSTIAETVWANRFGYVDGLNALGASLAYSDGHVSIEGGRPPLVAGQRVHAPDLRAAAVLVLAALEVDGDTVVTGTDHLGRGYADLPRVLRALGADVNPVEMVA